MLVNNPGGAAAHDAADHAADCEKMSDRERATHNQLYPDAPCEEGPVPGGNGDDGNGDDDTDTDTVSPSQANGFVATAAEGRTVELEWRPIAGATGYEIRYRNLDMAGSAWTTIDDISVDTLMHTLEDDDLVDGALYAVQLRAAGESSWDDASSLEVLGPVIQFSSDTPFMQYTGLPISWELPRASQAKGDMVRYSIVPALPDGLMYGQEAGEAYVDLAASENPSITGAVGHTVGGSKQFYRLMGCDVEKGIPDDESCDTHIFQIEITPATVKPLADVIRDREYPIGVALVTSALNQFPQVGVDDADDNYEYSLLDQEDYTDLDVPGLEFNDQTLELSGTPEGPVDKIKVTYRAQRPGSSVWHEAQFTIHIVAIESHVCRTGLNYEETLRVYSNETETVGAANFTVRVDAGSYYVLPIGEEGQQGTGATSTRTFELITVERGGDLAGPEANMLPAGLQVVKLMVDADSVNPLNDLYTRQGFLHKPSAAVMEQMMDNDGRYADPEPDYPDTDSGMRLAVGVSDAYMLKEGEHLSCFIVHDTDDDTGETDSSAVVFNLNVLPNLSARDWVHRAGRRWRHVRAGRG